MRHPVEIKHEHYRQLFLRARADRAEARGSIAMPVAATAFTAFSLGTLAQNLDPARATEPLGLAVGLLAIASIIALLGAVYCAVRAEWRFVHVEPADLPEIARIEDRIPPGHHSGLDSVLSGELQDLLTGSYYVGHEAYLTGNAETHGYRMTALRLILTSLACLAVAMLVLPFHLGGGSPP